MASTVTAQNLEVSITESITLAGTNYNQTKSLVIPSIKEVYKRVVRCIDDTDCTIATFRTATNTADNALDLENVKYIRVTNLDDNAEIELAIVTTATNYQVTITAGNSHILSQGAAIALGEADTSPSFGTMEDLASLQVKPVGASYNPQVEIFVGLE